MTKTSVKNIGSRISAFYRHSPVKACVITAIIIGVLSNVGFAYWAWQNWVVAERNVQLQKLTEQYAKKARSNVSAYLFSMYNKVEFFTRSEALAKALERQDLAVITDFKNKIEAGFDDIEGVRLIPTGTAEVDLTSTLPLRFTDIEMVKRAEEREKVLPEGVKYEQGWRLNFVEPVPMSEVEPMEESEPVMGTILITLQFTHLFSQLAEEVSEFGEVVLWQRYGKGKQHRLFSKGNGVDTFSVRQDIPGTPWFVEFKAGQEILNDAQIQYQMLPMTLTTIALIALASLAVLSGCGALVGRVIHNRMHDMDQALKVGASDVGLVSSSGAHAAVDINSLDLEGDAVLLGLSDGELEEESTDAKTNVGSSSEPTIDEAKVPVHIFRSYDIRGLAETEITTEFCKMLGQALGTEALDHGENYLVVGRDSRVHSPLFTEYLIRGILSTGCNVKNIGTVPTPLVYYATEVLDETRSGVMVTASHNPAEFNGFKVVMASNPRMPEDIQALRDRMLRGAHATGIGQEEPLDITSQYIDAIFSDVALAGDMSIVVDAGHGATGTIAPRLFEELGCDVTTLYCDLDGNFPSHGPDPSEEANLQDLIAKVKDVGADLGVAFDGDGDRLAVVTSTGKIIWPDRLMMLFAQDVLARHPGADVVYDVKSSRQLNQVISAAGGRPIMWKTGHAPMRAKIKETGAQLGGEYSGHIFIKDRWYGFDDALYVAARLIEIMSLRDESLDELFEQYPEIPSTPDVRVPVDESQKFEIIERLALEGEFESGKLTTLDGVRVDFAYGWGLVRASNTGAALTLRAEADTADQLHQIKALLTRQLRKIDNTLSINW